MPLHPAGAPTTKYATQGAYIFDSAEALTRHSRVDADASFLLRISWN
jgi:hypothetical protein